MKDLSYMCKNFPLRCVNDLIFTKVQSLIFVNQNVIFMIYSFEL